MILRILFWVVIVLLALAVIYFCRELNCWYLKINTRNELLENMVKNQDEIIRLLKKQIGEKEVLEVSTPATK